MVSEFPVAAVEHLLVSHELQGLRGAVSSGLLRDGEGGTGFEPGQAETLLVAGQLLALAEVGKPGRIRLGGPAIVVFASDTEWRITVLVQLPKALSVFVMVA